MNKQELVAAIAAQTGGTKKDTEGFLAAFEAVVVKAVSAGKKVQLIGFMTIEKVKRAAREGRNPQTGAPMKIPASWAVKVKAGKKFKDAVN